MKVRQSKVIIQNHGQSHRKQSLHIRSMICKHKDVHLWDRALPSFPGSSDSREQVKPMFSPVINL